VKQRARLQGAQEASSACVKDADHSVVAASAHPLSGLPSSRQNGDSFAGRLIVDAFDVIDASQRPPANHVISASHKDNARTRHMRGLHLVVLQTRRNKRQSVMKGLERQR
jgi:hypothetical protein